MEILRAALPREVQAKLQKEMLKTQTDMRAAFSKVGPDRKKRRRKKN